MAATGAGERGAVHEVATMVLRQHRAGDVHFATADVSVQVDRARHHDHAGDVDVLVVLGRRTRVGDDATIFDEDIAHFSPDPVGRIDNGSALELEPHRSGHPRALRIASSAAAALTVCDSRSLRSGSVTTLSAR